MYKRVNFVLIGLIDCPYFDRNYGNYYNRHHQILVVSIFLKDLKEHNYLLLIF